ncbi:MAG TPA: hypothetical protein DCS13_09820 [Candidatus Margulisbacteria bacterium]|nr:hypothetical protein [Candidatus Margulisiibacteriota bacterium]
MIKTGMFGQETPDGTKIGNFFMDINKHLKKKMFMPMNSGLNSAKNKALEEFTEPNPSFQKALYRSMTENMEGHKEADGGYEWTGQMQNYLLESLKFLSPFDRADWSGLTVSQNGGPASKSVKKYKTVNGVEVAKDTTVIDAEKLKAEEAIKKIPHVHNLGTTTNNVGSTTFSAVWDYNELTKDYECKYYVDSPFVNEKLKNGNYGHYIQSKAGTPYMDNASAIADSHWGQQNFGGEVQKAWAIGLGKYFKNVNFLGAASDWNNIYSKPLKLKDKDSWDPAKHLTPPGGKQEVFENILNPQASGKIGATNAKIGDFEIKTERTPYNVTISGLSDNGWISSPDTNLKLRPDDLDSNGTPLKFDKDCNISFLLNSNLNGQKGRWAGNPDFNLYRWMKEGYWQPHYDIYGEYTHSTWEIKAPVKETYGTTPTVSYYNIVNGVALVLTISNDGTYSISKGSRTAPEVSATWPDPAEDAGPTYSGTYGACRTLNDDAAHFNTGFMSTDTDLPQVTGPVWQMVQNVLNLYKPYNKNEQDSTGNGGGYTEAWYKNTNTQYAYTGGWRDIAVNNIYKDIDTNIQTNYSNIFPGVTFSADQTKAKKQVTALHKLCLMIGLNESRRRYTLAMNVLMGSHDITDKEGNKTYWWNTDGGTAPDDSPNSSTWTWPTPPITMVIPSGSTLSGIVWNHYQIGYPDNSGSDIFAKIVNYGLNDPCFPTNNANNMIAGKTLYLPKKSTTPSPSPSPSPSPITSGIVVGDKDIDWYNTMLFQIFTTTIHPIYNNMHSIFNNGSEAGSVDGAWAAYGYDMRKWLLDIDLDSTQDNFATTELDMTLLNDLNFGTDSTDSLTGLKTAYYEFENGSKQAFPKDYLNAAGLKNTTDLENYDGLDRFTTNGDTAASPTWFSTQNQFFIGYRNKVVKILAGYSQSNINNGNKIPTAAEIEQYGKGPKSLAKYYMEHQDSTTNWAVHDIATSIYAEEEIVKESIKDYVINSAIQSVTDREWKEWEDNIKKKTDANTYEESMTKRADGKQAAINRQLELEAEQHAIERRKQLLSLAAKKKAQNKNRS